MEKTLKSICDASKKLNSLFTRDWDLVPLPCLPREGKQPPFYTVGPNYSQLNSKLEQLQSSLSFTLNVDSSKLAHPPQLS